MFQHASARYLHRHRQTNRQAHTHIRTYTYTQAHTRNWIAYLSAGFGERRTQIPVADHSQNMLATRFFNHNAFISLGHDVFYLCFSSSARIDFSLWRDKKKISKKMRPSGQVRVDKYCPRQAHRKRQIARRKQQYYGDSWRRWNC